MVYSPLQNAHPPAVAAHAPFWHEDGEISEKAGGALYSITLLWKGRVPAHHGIIFFTSIRGGAINLPFVEAYISAMTLKTGAKKHPLFV
jgi:hypothetical protein